MQFGNSVRRDLGVLVTAVLLVGGSFILPIERAHAAPQPKSTLQLQEQPAMAVININKATAEELDAIRGVGPVLADRIIKFREENGGFKSVDDLSKVRGISGAKFQKIKNQVTI
ncbi:MAG: helix-hairpin-helix domain-containing protein [Candidatus Omnitrophica bacterium]|nr:helix-hairpin-helix domain-containing protein [Candidatus Omnitrophota bacterium]